jgi:hypothetical protein
MAQVTWQRSSFSGGGGNNCVEVAPAGDHFALRESETPSHVLILGPRALGALIRRAQSCTPADSR